MTLKVLSTFAGIGGFDLGFERAGMQVVGQVEMNPYASQILKTHYPNVLNPGDIQNVRGNEFGAIDLICGGFPCQDVSVAGKRAGLAGKRSGLFFEVLRLLDRVKPEWFVLENVPGLLSVNGGRDFATVLFCLSELGYSIAWRILDAKHFGVPQRRRRIFFVGHFRDGRAAQVLFERESVSGRCSSEFSEGSGSPRAIAGTLPASGSGTSRAGGQGNTLDLILYPRPGLPVEFIRRIRSDHFVSDTIASTLVARDANDFGDLVYQNGIRRLTPVECERLQGFPDSWTHGLSDTQRYKALGNAVAVPVAQWIGERIINANSN